MRHVREAHVWSIEAKEVIILKQKRIFGIKIERIQKQRLVFDQ